MPELPLMVLTRFWRDAFGTYGSLTSGKVRCFTVEPPDLGNVPWHSCIPNGKYLIRRGMFGRGDPPYPDLELVEVPGRTNIEIHAANDPSDLDGCIAPAEMLRWQADHIVGRNSKHMLSVVLESFIGDQAWLLIR